MPRLLLILLLALPLLGCDGWKRFDHRAGLLLTPNVDTLRVDDQLLIRIQNRRARLFIDPAGARVTAYHLRAGYGDDLGSPNVFASGQWRTLTVPPLPALDQQTAWQTHAYTAHLELLSDSVQGLRWRKTFHLHDNGVADVAVALENVTGQPIAAGFKSLVEVDGKLVEQGGAHHLWRDGQWFSRQIVSRLEHTADFAALSQTINPRDAISWTERWWITPDPTGESPPLAPPPLPRDPLTPHRAVHPIIPAFP